MTDQQVQGTTYTTAAQVVARWPGAKVFPVAGKMPVFHEAPNGSRSATDDHDKFAPWWLGTNYGVGVTGILAIDGDDLDATLDSMPDCLTTGVQISGNPERITFLFQQPTDPFGDGKHPGGEVKGSGYVVLPPSRHQGDTCALCLSGEQHEYRWLTGDGESVPDLPPCPPELEAHLATFVRRRQDNPAPAMEVPALWQTEGHPCRTVTALVDEAVSRYEANGVAKHEVMTNVVMRMLRYGEQGHAGVGVAMMDLYRAHRTACEPFGVSRLATVEAEFGRALRGAVPQIEANPTDGADYGCCLEEPAPASITTAVFTASDVLAHIHAWAQARRVGPWAVLGGAMARAVAEVPPMVHLPPYVGDDASLNLYVGLVDQSGAGKSAGYKASGRAFNGMVYARHVPNGTGEGLIESFIQKSSKADVEAGAPRRRLHDNPQVLMYVDEIGQLQTGQARQGSTIDPVLRSMWNGEEVGTNNADEDRNRHLTEHTYRLCLVAGVQPGLAGGLLNTQATASGTAQRWLWLPVADPQAPLVRPELPAVRHWPGVGASPHVRWIEYPEHVREVVDEARLKTLRGIDVSEADKVRAHENLMHMKVAGALAVLHGTLVVDDLLWRVAGDIMEVSSRTRGAVIRSLAGAEARTAEQRGRAAAAARQGEGEAAAEQVERVARAVWRVIDRHDHGDEGCSRKCITQTIGRDRIHKDAAIEYATDMSWIDTRQEGEVTRYVRGTSRPD